MYTIIVFVLHSLTYLFNLQLFHCKNAPALIDIQLAALDGTNKFYCIIATLYLSTMIEALFDASLVIYELGAFIYSTDCCDKPLLWYTGFRATR